jgi:hypothetical protein
MDVLQDNMPIGVGLLALSLMVLAVFRWAAMKPGLRPYLPRQMLTANELEFWDRLNAAVPELIVLPQVAMSALVDTRRGLTPKERTAARNRFAQKRCDFVVAGPPRLEVLVLIELDDRTHEPRRDERRDAITAAAGYRTLRYRSKAKPSVQQLRSDILAVGSSGVEGAALRDEAAVPSGLAAEMHAPGRKACRERDGQVRDRARKAEGVTVLAGGGS